MDRPIEPLEPERVLPTDRFRRDRPRQDEPPFSLAKQDDDDEDEADERPPQDRHVGPRDEDEAGGQLDVTA